MYSSLYLHNVVQPSECPPPQTHIHTHAFSIVLANRTPSKLLPLSLGISLSFFEYLQGLSYIGCMCVCGTHVHACVHIWMLCVYNCGHTKHHLYIENIFCICVHRPVLYLFFLSIYLPYFFYQNPQVYFVYNYHIF